MDFKLILSFLVVFLLSNSYGQIIQGSKHNVYQFKIDLNYRAPMISYVASEDSLLNEVSQVDMEFGYKLNYSFAEGKAANIWTLIKDSTKLKVEWVFENDVPILTVIYDSLGNVMRKLVRNNIGELIYSEGSTMDIKEFMIQNNGWEYSQNINAGKIQSRVQKDDTLIRKTCYDYNCYSYVREKYFRAKNESWIKDGVWIFKFKNSALELREQYRNDSLIRVIYYLDGLESFYDTRVGETKIEVTNKNGELVFSGIVKQGKKNGFWNYYNPNTGKLFKQDEFKDGALVNRSEPR